MSFPARRRWSLMGLVAFVGVIGGCGKGHVHRGVQDAASQDLSCPADQIELEEIDSTHYEVTGCGKTGRYRWVDGRPVADGDPTE